MLSEKVQNAYARLKSLKPGDKPDVADLRELHKHASMNAAGFDFRSLFMMVLTVLINLLNPPAPVPAADEPPAKLGHHKQHSA